MTSQDIHNAIQGNGRGQQPLFLGDYAYLKEFRNTTGFSASERYLDAWLIQCWPSKPLTAIAIEIKVSKSDFRSELKNSMKRDPALRISNQFYFAAPAGLINEEELPPEAGLISVDKDGKASIQVEAPYRDCSFNLPFIASLARRCSAPPGLNEEILRLRKRNDTLEQDCLKLAAEIKRLQGEAKC